MYNGIKFLSVFKIGDKPILRPCLSESKREEIRRFKAKALEIERRNAEKTKGASVEEEVPENLETFLGDIESISVHSENHTDNDADHDNFVTSISEWDISSIPGVDCIGVDIQDGLCSGATEIFDQIENTNDTAGQSNDTIVNAPLPSSIIRSDSFIVDQPSECFLKQLEDNGVVVPSNTSSVTDASIKTDVNQTKIFVKPVVKRKPEVKKATTPKLKKYPPKPFGFKKGRVTSDNISNLPEKLIRKRQTNTVNVSEIRKERQEKSMSKQSSSNESRKSISQVESIFTQTEINDESSNESINDRTAEIIADIEEKFRNEIAFFLEKQKREQDAFLRKLMTQVKAKQDAFQCSLVTQIKSMIDEGVSKFLQNQANLSNLSFNTNTLNDMNGNSSFKDRGNDGGQNEINKAATKINAFIRGYLTRRLFKTEHVQHVIKTIRDSLYLVIDLHFEKTDEESVADIQMKHNLLQQLESNRYSLFNIFTTKTIAEQMAMIAFDRQLIANRLLQSKARNNNIYEGPLKVNQRSNPTTERPNSMNDRQKSKDERPTYKNEHSNSMNEYRMSINEHSSSINERPNVMTERPSSMSVEDKFKKLKIVVL